MRFWYLWMSRNPKTADSHLSFSLFFFNLSPVFFDSAHSLRRTFLFKMDSNATRANCCFVSGGRVVFFFLFALLTLHQCRPSRAPAMDEVRTDTYLTQVWYPSGVVWVGRICDCGSASIWWKCSSAGTWHIGPQTAAPPQGWGCRHLYVRADMYQVHLRERQDWKHHLHCQRSCMCFYCL